MTSNINHTKLKECPNKDNENMKYRKHYKLRMRAQKNVLKIVKWENLPSDAALRSMFAFIKSAAASVASIPAAPVQ